MKTVVSNELEWLWLVISFPGSYEVTLRSVSWRPLKKGVPLFPEKESISKGENSNVEQPVFHTTPIVSRDVGFCWSSPWCANQTYARNAEVFESPQVLHVSEVLPPDVTEGPDYRIQDLVYNDGLLNRFDINSDYGFLSVEGSDLLKVRLQEIEALWQMEELKRTQLYGDAFKKAATGPLKLAKGLIRQPLDTLSGVGTGIGKWFSQIGHTVYGDPSETEEGTLKVIFGFDQMKRNLAYEFGVDPYSTNPLLQKRLNSISWTAFAGNMTVRAAFMAIPGAAGMAVSGTGFSKSMRILARDKTPAELKKYNREKLKAMGVDEDVAETFLDHPKWSPTATTYLVGALEQMNEVKGIGKPWLRLQPWFSQTTLYTSASGRPR